MLSLIFSFILANTSYETCKTTVCTNTLARLPQMLIERKSNERIYISYEKSAQNNHENILDLGAANAYNENININ